MGNCVLYTKCSECRALPSIVMRCFAQSVAFCRNSKNGRDFYAREGRGRIGNIDKDFYSHPRAQALRECIRTTIIVVNYTRLIACAHINCEGTSEQLGHASDNGIRPKEISGVKLSGAISCPIRINQSIETVYL